MSSQYEIVYQPDPEHRCKFPPVDSGLRRGAVIRCGKEYCKKTWKLDDRLERGLQWRRESIFERWWRQYWND